MPRRKRNWAPAPVGAFGHRVAAGLAVCASLLLACSPDPPAPRSVVLIVVDTLRADHLGVYGYPRATSPRIDALAADSVVFSRPVSPSPWTLPSLATLMTSLYPSVHGATAPSNVDARPWLHGDESFTPVTALHDSRTTLAELLREHGFATAGFVQGSYPSQVFGFDQGFDRYSDAKTPGIRFDVEDALRWLDDERPDRFFLYLHVVEVHAPYSFLPMERRLMEARAGTPIAYWREAIAEERARLEAFDFDRDYGGALDGRVSTLRELGHARDGVAPRDLEHLVSLYDSGIRYVDFWIGRLLDGLMERNLYEDSTIIVTSDHGEEFLEHGGFGHGHSFYEEMLHVPLIMRLPREGRGVRVEQAVGLIDVMPTLVDVLELDVDMAMQGRSLRPLWRGASSIPRDLLGEANHDFSAIALHTGTHKYVRRRAGQQELFDLHEDRTEQIDLCRSNPAACRTMRARLQALVKENRRLSRELALPSPEPAEVDEESLERLRALGYAQP